MGDADSPLGNRNPQIFYRMAKVAGMGEEPRTNAKVDKFKELTRQIFHILGRDPTREAKPDRGKRSKTNKNKV